MQTGEQNRMRPDIKRGFLMALIFCPVCNGSGNENRVGYVRCSLCDGTGTIESEHMDELTAGIPMEERE
jgi:DnaJ-class molecular chaperone